MTRKDLAGIARRSQRLANGPVPHEEHPALQKQVLYEDFPALVAYTLTLTEPSENALRDDREEGWFDVLLKWLPKADRYEFPRDVALASLNRCVARIKELEEQKGGARG